MRNHLAFACVLAGIIGCGSKTPPSSTGPSLPNAVSDAVGAEKGGRVGDEHGASVTVPPGAVERYVQIALKPSSPETHATPDVRIVGAVWSVTVDGNEHHTFAKPVRLAIPWDPALVVGDAPVGLSVWQDGHWQDVPGARADAASRLVIADVDHFTEYAPSQKPAKSFDPADSAKRFTNIEKWYGSVVISIRGSGSRHDSVNGGERRFTISREAEVRFEIKAQPGEAEALSAYERIRIMSPGKLPPEYIKGMENMKNLRHWRSEFTNRAKEDEDDASLTVNDQFYERDEMWGCLGREGPDQITKRSLTGGSSGKAASAHELEIDVAKGTYSLSCSGVVSGMLTFIESRSAGDGRNETHPATAGWVFRDLPVPSSGGVISGSRKITKKEMNKYIPGTGNWEFDYGTTGGMITWTLSPVPFEDVELVIKPDGYDSWVPEGGENENTKGNSIKMTATLRHRGIGPTKATLHDLSLSFKDLSYVPGVCLNVPLKGAAATQDLKFAPESEGTVNATATGLFKRGEFTDLKFTIDCYDWGAWGSIVGQGTLTDGRTVWAVLDGDSSMDEIRLPKRDESSKVADAWKKEMDVEGFPDTDDKERQSGNYHDGDGLTVYEEYRGLFANGKHTRKAAAGKDGIKPLTPGKKDLVIHLDSSIKGKSGVDAGLLLFEKASGIHIVEVNDKEMPLDSRIVNVNVDTKLTAGDQRGLIVFKATLAPGSVGETQRNERLPGKSRLAYPTVKIDIDQLKAGHAAGLPYSLDDDIANTVAHEIAHGCSVEHHGSDHVVPINNGQPIPAGSPMKVFGTDGTEDRTRPYTLVNPGAIGEPGNSASGNMNCIMCYNHVYQWSYHSPDKIFAVPDAPPGRIFCTNADATGHNAPRPLAGSGTPPKTVPGVFGKATLGNCLGQMFVKDQ